MSEVYKLELPGQGITFEVDRLRRDRHELIGELTVSSTAPKALTVNGRLSTGDFNFSSVRARQERAKFLAQRANSNGAIDWFSLLEEFCQKVFEGERTGDPSVDLKTMARPERGDEIRIDGLVFPRRHPSILFGDGGAAKSYTALYIAGQLAKDGLNIALFDWELSGEDHRDRLERIFGADMPVIRYCRCERPLPAEMDRLRRVVRDHKIDYAISDSVAFACGGRPEDAEVAGEYFRAVRQIGVGGLHIAHINRSDNNDQKPFGSSFWHNGARSTWFVMAAERLGGSPRLELGFFNRKSNLGALARPVSWILTFDTDQTNFVTADLCENPDLAIKLTVRQRMFHLLRRGPLPAAAVASEIEAELETVKKTARRNTGDFTITDDGIIGLLRRQS